MQIYLKNEVVDRAMGCLFGSFIGDALGSYLEFAKEKDYDALMKNGTDCLTKLWRCPEEEYLD
jgi:ADP-ribosylglycohydrolase